MTLINNTKQLQDACKALKKQKVIAIDCEFIREKTYYPIPCLIQIGYASGAILIDPLAEDMDMQVFFEILQNNKILKVFHSGRQDIEILYNLSGQIPGPVFDTQIAAQACGLGESVSYENLVRYYCNTELDKSCRLTNWQMRPLTEEQLAYAAGDVTHLLVCYEKIASYLQETNRQAWIKEEMDDLIDLKHYAINPEDAWQKIRHNIHSSKFLNALKTLASWREKRAMRQNVSRQTIIKDEILVNIATANPKNAEELRQVRGMRADIAHSVLATEILQALAELKAHGLDKTLVKIDREKEVSLPSSGQSLYEILKLLLKIKSIEYGVVTHLITSEKNLREYIINPKKNIISSGWRYEVFGKIAAEFCRGELAITYNPEQQKIHFLENKNQ